MHVCEVLLAQRMLPEWLEVFTCMASHSGKGGIASCEALHGPEYRLLYKTSSTVQFVLRYK